MSTSTVIVLALIVVAVIWAIGIYNGLVSMRQRVNQAFADSTCSCGSGMTSFPISWRR